MVARAGGTEKGTAASSLRGGRGGRSPGWILVMVLEVFVSVADVIFYEWGG